MRKSDNDPLDRSDNKSNKVTKWFKGYGRATSEEFEGRIGSSIKRIIKFIALSFIPVLYGVICLVAFWNPIPNIGKSNVTFIDQEGEVLLATHDEMAGLEAYQIYQNDDVVNTIEAGKDKNPNFMSTLLEKSEDGTYVENNAYDINKKDDYLPLLKAWIDNPDNDNYDFSTNKAYTSADGTTAPGLDDIDASIVVKDGDKYVTQSVSYSIDKATIGHIYCVSGFELLTQMGVLTPNKSIAPGSGNSAEDVTYSTAPLTEQKIAFTNVHYQKWSNKGESTWHSYKSYLQIKMGGSFMRSVLDTANFYYFGMQNALINTVKSLGLDLSTGIFDPSITITKDQITAVVDQMKQVMQNQLPRLADNQLDIWTTFARNFIYGYYLNTINEFRDALPAGVLKDLAPALDEKIVDVIKNAVGDASGPIATQIVGMLKDLKGSIMTDLSNVDQAINFEIEGADNGIYGIGLGEFFLLIGLYVGTLMHTFVYDRAKRGGAKVSHSQWFFSKMTLMVVTGFVQVTLLVLIAAAAGWSRLGVDRLFELWGALLLVDLAFKITIQALWFSVKDETIGKFLCVVYMILNLSAGWGTFPSFMQFGFFHGVSYITEFTYSLHLMGVVIYGGNYSGDWRFALQQVGILIAFIAVFMSFGFGMSILRNREMHFGTYRGRYLTEGFEALGHKDLAESFKAKGWRGVPHDVVMTDMVDYMRVHHPFEKQFKRYKNGVHPDPIKPNYSDDDIFSRNDDVAA